MNRFQIGCVAILLFLVAAAPLTAEMVTITDTYIGGMPTNASYKGLDVIGEPASFDISSMTVDLDRQARRLSVSILSGYMDNIGAYSTELGDLFLSTAGWKLTSSDTNGYKNDTYTAGEWNYVVALDNHLATGGTARLYAITDANVKQSWAPEGYVYRAGQAVQVTNLSGLTAVGTGTWGVDAASKVLSLSIGFGTAFDNAQQFGFSWGMSCANDVIQGGASFAAVPEPGLVMLLVVGAGLLVVLGRRRLAVVPVVPGRRM